VSARAPGPGTARVKVDMDSSTASRLRRAGAFIGPYRITAAVLFVLALLIAGINAVEPLVLKYLFDDFHRGGRMRALLTGTGVLIGLALVRELVTGTSNWLTWRMRLGLQHDLLRATVDRLHLLPLSFHQAHGVGATMTRLDRGIQGLVTALTDVAFTLLPALVYLAIAVLIMLRLEWRLALIVLAFAPVPAIISGLAVPRQARRERVLLDRWSKIYARFNEVLSGIVTVKTFVMEEDEKRRFLNDAGAANRVVLRGGGFDSTVTGAQNLAINAARIAAVAYGGCWRCTAP